jgi:hypothetical protein
MKKFFFEFRAPVLIETSRSYLKENLIKRSLALTTAIAMVLTGLGVSAANANGCSLAQTGTVVTGIGTCSNEIIIPNGVTSIGANAFVSSALVSVTIPNSVTSIGNYAFYDSRELVTVNIGNGVTSIGESAFETNIALTSITFAADSALTTIGQSAFYLAMSLADITIPSGVTSIGDYAFYVTGALSKVRFLGNVAPTVGTDAFYLYSPRTTRAIVNDDAAKASFTPIVAGKWNSLRVVTLAEAEAEDVVAAAERLAAAVIAAASVAKSEADAALALRNAEKMMARGEIEAKSKRSESISVELFTQAGISGINKENIEAVQAEIAALPEESRGYIGQILKIARKYEVVGIIASDRVISIHSKTLIEVGIIPADGKNKEALTDLIKHAEEELRSSLAAITELVVAETAEIQARIKKQAVIVLKIKSRQKG